MNARPSGKPPAAVIVYGFAGLIPFFVPAVLALLFPEHKPLFQQALIWWAAIILSFLGGARWGMAVQAPAPNARLIGMAMLPSIFAWVALLAPISFHWQITLLIGGFGLMLIWDRRAGSLPNWYGWLRGWLTVLAIVGLQAGLLVI